MEGREWLRRPSVRWAVAGLSPALVFAVSWWIAQDVAGMEQSNAIAVASTAAATVLTLAGVWAAVTPAATSPVPALSAPGSASGSAPSDGGAGGSAGSLGAVPPTIAGATDPPPVTPPRPNQLVVGAIPHGAAALQERPELVEKLRALRSSTRPALVCAVTGQRGVGKTQLAADYARLCVAEGWSVVVWIVAEDEDQIIAGLAEVADRSGLRTAEMDSASAARQALSWLQTRPEPGLLVYDNVIDEDVVARWLPTAGRTQVVVTAVQAIEALGASVAVDLFTEAEAQAYLAERTRLRDKRGARRLAEELGRLPLALAQAAAVIGPGKRHRSYQSYLARLAAVPATEAIKAEKGSGYLRGAAQAIQLSIQEVADVDPSGAAGQMLDLLAVFSAAGVEVSLLEKALPLTDSGAAMAALANRSLLIRNAGGRSVAVHRLIRRVVLDNLRANGTFDTVLSSAATAVNATLVPRTEAWRQRRAGQALLNQVEELWTSATSGPIAPATTIALLELRVWAVGHLVDVYDYSRAIDLGREVVKSCEQTVGVQHPTTLTARNNLAGAFQASGRLGAAVTLYERTLERYRTALGPRHPDTLSAANNLAIAYCSADRLPEAIALYEQIIADSEQVLGADDPDTLSSRNNLAGAYEDADRLPEAIALYEQNLADRQRVLGRDHPDTLASRNNLAGAYLEDERTEDAIALYEQNLGDRQRVLGADDPHTHTSRSNLAGAYLADERVDEAIALYERAVADRQRVLGAGHVTTLTTRKDLAAAYLAAHRRDEAIAVLTDALQRAEKVLGDDHRLTRQIRDDLDTATLDEDG